MTLVATPTPRNCPVLNDLEVARSKLNGPDQGKLETFHGICEAVKTAEVRDPQAVQTWVANTRLIIGEKISAAIFRKDFWPKDAAKSAHHLVEIQDRAFAAVERFADERKREELERVVASQVQGLARSAVDGIWQEIQRKAENLEQGGFSSEEEIAEFGNLLGEIAPFQRAFPGVADHISQRELDALWEPLREYRRLVAKRL